MIRMPLKLILLVILFSFAAGCQENNNEPENGSIKKTFYDGGELESTTTLVNGKKVGIQKYFFENGKLASTVNYVNDKMEGELKAYYKNGQLRMAVHYDKGILNGESTRFYEDGKLERIQKYEKGKLIYEKKFTKDGQVQYEDHY